MTQIPPWGLWMLMLASAVGTVLLFGQLRALHWRIR